MWTRDCLLQLLMLVGLTHHRASPPPVDQPQNKPDQLSGIEGLGKKGVDPGIKAGLHLTLRTRTDDGERKITSPRIVPQPSGGPDPVEPGHDDIKRDNVGPHPMNDFQTLGTIGRGHDLEALQLEIDPDQLPDDLVVVHNKHPTRRAWHNSRVGRPRPPRPGFPHFHPTRATRPPRGCGNPLMTTPSELVVFYPSPGANNSPRTPP